MRTMDIYSGMGRKTESEGEGEGGEKRDELIGIARMKVKEREEVEKRYQIDKCRKVNNSENNEIVSYLLSVLPVYTPPSGY